MKITVVGLGLIGGSIAKKLRGFKDAEIIGVDKNKETLESALKDGAIDRGAEDFKEVASESDFVIFAVIPSLVVSILRETAHLLKKGTILTDVCGIKATLFESLESVLPDGIEFVGGHPMAGKEQYGYSNSESSLFEGANYILVPYRNSEKSLEFIKEFARYLGAGNLVVTTAEKHDMMIAYTSQLMHAVAVALCTSPLLTESSEYAAGSLRDCTRVAILDAPMWSELFLHNKDALAQCIGEFQESLEDIKKAVLEGDKPTLQKIMETATENKKKYFNR